MKRLVTISISALLIASLMTGCSTNENSEKGTTTEQPSTTVEETVDSQEDTDTNSSESSAETESSEEKAAVIGALAPGFIKAETAALVWNKKDQLNLLDDFKKILGDSEGDERKQPYVATYFADDETLESEELMEVVMQELIYPIESKEESSALKVYTQYHEIQDITIDEFTGAPSNSYMDSTYKVNIYPFSEITPYAEDFDYQMFSLKYLNKSIPELEEALGAKQPFGIISHKSVDKSVYFFFANDGKNADNSVHFIEAIVENGRIINIKTTDPRIELSKINNYYK